ncbi:uncharacterized protein LOC122092225 [Macadamia integrifolia]|uniref:uncharacterized protein LOC122092225 n=1 Tax=Macadamia integrifolia TaxID=60698 RepID=UPI001C4FE3D3|nr:uncharacterized protein LOC122092225 [Macadamia integrifolia]
MEGMKVRMDLVAGLDMNDAAKGLSDLVAKRKIKALNGLRGVATPTHSLFADDIFVFSNASIRKLGLSIQAAPSRLILEVFWSKPYINWIKLNFDGSSMGNPSQAGAGGIFRDHLGRVLGSYKIFMGIMGVFEAEMEGLMEGLMRARDMGINQLWVV